MTIGIKRTNALQPSKFSFTNESRNRLQVGMIAAT
jgi:hypothetical protein